MLPSYTPILHTFIILYPHTSVPVALRSKLYVDDSTHDIISGGREGLIQLLRGYEILLTGPDMTGGQWQTVTGTVCTQQLNKNTEGSV